MLKAIFGFLGLLIALAVIASLMKTQLGALGQLGQSTTRVQGSANSTDSSTSTSTSTGSMAGKSVGGARLDAFGATAGADMPSGQAAIQGVQNNVRDRTVDALQKGVERSNRAQP
jgi:hypothetical protein